MNQQGRHKGQQPGRFSAGFQQPGAKARAGIFFICVSVFFHDGPHPTLSGGEGLFYLS
jgi:hypothetical protein